MPARAYRAIAKLIRYTQSKIKYCVSVNPAVAFLFCLHRAFRVCICESVFIDAVIFQRGGMGSHTPIAIIKQSTTTPDLIDCKPCFFGLSAQGRRQEEL
jgi:hypothetical protein